MTRPGQQFGLSLLTSTDARSFVLRLDTQVGMRGLFQDNPKNISFLKTYLRTFCSKNNQTN